MIQAEAGFLILCGEDGAIAAILHDGLGLLGPQWVGRPFTLLIAPGALAKALDFFSRIRTEGGQYGWEMPVEGVDRSMVFVGARHQGAVAVAASLTPSGLDGLVRELMLMNNEQANAIRTLFSGAGRPAGGLVPDLDEFSRLNTEFANMQRELARKNAELGQANDRKSLMLGMAAHDLRNPLTSIAGFAEFLQRRAADRLSASELQMLQHVRDSAAYMAGIVEGVLDVSQAELGRLVLNREPVEVDGLVAAAVAMNAVLGQPRDIAVQMRGQAGITLSGDRGKLMQVLNNLLGNAVKYSPSGATVTVTVAAGDGRVEVTVEDQGAGIPLAEQGKLFKPFSKTSVKPPAGGMSSGLGLAISRTIVEGHGGAIRVDSAPGKGSRFTLELPVQPVIAPGANMD